MVQYGATGKRIKRLTVHECLSSLTLYVKGIILPLGNYTIIKIKYITIIIIIMTITTTTAIIIIITITATLITIK